ncbi:unnamed protein product [Bursaphelenchus xylophilus]|uniref:Carboxylic ester hydrolase n=1 Tax=Bursaphelenchus xylophilus TaxID=6326 RepID=A0A1I7RXF8_BURXY|nr:unnamed protein product [Bursaphelenchus xylophilus]CAG9126377.1 unnamed protein product [Bursaphelenchus xylophilus]
MDYTIVLKIILVLFFCYSTWALDVGIDVDAAPKVDVRLSLGWIRGYEFKSKEGTANVFKRVPYISPPIGDLRFHSPVPAKSWEGILDATQPALACPQNTTDMDKYTWAAVKDQSEDCVYLNIYADNRCNATNPCPVLFYLHGGGNTFDGPRMFNDSLIVENFASHGVVWVLPSFRLGILGWMDIGESTVDAPYNAGMLDLIAALRWTQQEISAFGGNNRDIVLLGHSSGAHLASLVLSSPAVEANAFSRAFILSPAGRFLDHIDRPRSTFIAEKVGCIFDDNLEYLNFTQRVSCLRSKPYQELINSAQPMQDKRPDDIVAPQVDGYSMTQRTLYDLAQQWRPIKVFLGVMSYEGDFDVGYFDKDVCYTFMPYVCPGRLAECELKCREVFGGPHKIPIGGTFIQAYTWLVGHINTNKGGESYYQVFDQYHADVHADDLAFALGLHAKRKFHARNVGHQMQKRFFPKLLLRFILNQTLVEGWEPMDLQGRNYFYNNFKAIGDPDNYTVVIKPHYVKGEIYHQAAVDFWWRDLAELHKHDLRHLHSTPPPPAPSPVVVETTGVPWYIFLIVIVIALVLALALLVIVGVSFVWKARRVYKSDKEMKETEKGDGTNNSGNAERNDV